MVTPGDRLELLETFIRIAETGGIGAAARSLDTTQPTVSRRLQQLEALLDAKLVERSTQGMSLTAVGATLLPEAREVLARWRGLETAVDAESGAVSGIVRVIAPTPLGADVLPAIFAGFMDEHPEVRLEMRLKDGAVDLAAEGADFALKLGKTASDAAVVKEIAQIRRVLCAAPALADRLGHERGVALQRCEPLALEDAPLISLAPHSGGTHRFLGRNGESEEVRFDRVAAFDSIEPVLSFALQGFGLAILPRWRIAALLESGELRIVAAEWSADPTPVSLMWIPNRFRSAAASALLERVQEDLPALLEDDG